MKHPSHPCERNVLIAPPKPRTQLRLTITAKAGARFAPFLKRNLQAAHRLLKKRNRGLPLNELNIALVGDRRMSELHQEFLNVAGPTDVLTFPLETDRVDRAISGEVIVCVQVAERQAKANQIPVKHELLLYAIHGLLHLCGYDDRTAAGYREMHRLEDSILTELGLGPVFARTVESSKAEERR